MYDLILPSSVALPPGHIFGADLNDDTCLIVRESDLQVAIAYLHPGIDHVDGFISEPGAMCDTEVQAALDLAAFTNPMPWELN